MEHGNDNLRLQREQNNKKRRKLRRRLFRYVLIALAIYAAAVGLTVGWVLLEYDTFKDGIAAFVLSILLFLVFPFFVFYQHSSEIKEISEKLEKLKQEYELSLTEEEKENRECRKNRAVLITACAIFAAILAAILIPEIRVANEERELRETYVQAVTLTDAGSYSEAKELFETIKESEYKDTLSYIDLCRSHLNSERGEYVRAYNGLRGVKFYGLSEAQATALREYVDALYPKYLEADAKSKADAVKKASEQKFRHYEDAKPAETPKKKNKASKIKDPFNAKDYANEDFFYDDYRDDFSDYEEAEEYYNDHYDD